MRAIVVAVLCVLYAFGHVAHAELSKGTYAPDVEAREWLNTSEPVSLKEVRGMVVLLFFWVSWHEGGEYVMPLMNLINSKVLRTNGIYIMGLTDSDRARVEDMLKKQKVFFPIALESKSYEDYEITAFPKVVVIDPNGKVAWTGWPGAGGSELIKAIEEVFNETPPTKTHPEDAVVVRQKLDTARDALRTGELQAAHDAAREADSLAASGDALKTQCDDMLELIEALGRDQLARAQQLVDEKHYEEAINLLCRIRQEFKGMTAGRFARRKLETLEKKYDQVKRILEARGAHNEAERLLARAIAELQEKPRLIGPAYDKLEELAQDYPDTGAATKAQTLLERLRQNEGVMAYVRDHKAARECDMLLAQCRAFEFTGRPDKAKELYRRIMREFPETIYAEQAAERLGQLP